MSATSDLVRPIYEAWKRGDFSSTVWADPEIEMVVVDGPAPGTWTGLSQMTDVWRDTLGLWQSLRVEAEEIRELDDERVLVLMSFKGRGRASGLEVEQTGMKGANVFHVRDGRVTRLVLYWHRERALVDFGLTARAT